MNNTRKRLVIMMAISSSILHPASSLLAQAPSLINYQGRLLNGTNLVNGNVGLSLRLFNVASGGTKLYEDSNTVTVADGLYATFIGDHPTNSAFLAALTNPAVWVEAAVNGVTLTPRERLASVGYSLSTRGVLVMTNGSIVVNPEGNSIANNSLNAAISGGLLHQIGSNAQDAVIGGGSNNVIDTRSSGALIAGGARHVIGTNSRYSVVVGGLSNDIRPNSPFSFIGGGVGNQIETGSQNAVIGGGSFNAISNNGSYSTIAGGSLNEIEFDAEFSTIGGGFNNRVASNSLYAAVAGGRLNAIGANTDYALVGGGFSNAVAEGANYSAIVGGLENSIAPGSSFAAIGGGGRNRITDQSGYAVIAGGSGNHIGTNASYAVIGGGFNNSVNTNASFTTIGGGGGNIIRTRAAYATISGGGSHEVGSNSLYSTIAGGLDNSIGPNATNAFAAGRQAKANHRGAFVWGDDTGADVASTANNQVTFRAGGGFRVLSGELQAQAGLRVGTNGTSFDRFLAGTAVLGTGINVAVYSVAFPGAFSIAPRVVVTPRNDPSFNVNDTFVATVRSVTTTNFVVNVVRVDANAPWAQQLRADWFAWE
jgi:hypothetical protein